MKKQTAPKAPAKPKLVPVKRIKEVSDSLAMSGLAKTKLASDLSKRKTPASEKLAKEFKSGAKSDLDRAVRYDNIQKQAVNKAKKKK